MHVNVNIHYLEELGYCFYNGKTRLFFDQMVGGKVENR